MMNAAREFRRAVNESTPKRRAKNVRTGALMATRRIAPDSGVAATVTLLAPFVYPFLAASSCAAATAPGALPGRYTTPASAAASEARWSRTMFNSYQPMSATSPMKPKRAVSTIATITRVCPRSSPQLARRIFGHHGALRDRELIEDRHEVAERGASAIRITHGHPDGVRRADVVPCAGLPRLTLLHEVKVVAVNHRPAVQLVRPYVHEPPCLG